MTRSSRRNGSDVDTVLMELRDWVHRLGLKDE